jgi:hypothetical protein
MIDLHLTVDQAKVVLELVSAAHDDNTAGLRGEGGWHYEGEIRQGMKTENVDLRAVRDRIRRELKRCAIAQ